MRRDFRPTLAAKLATLGIVLLATSVVFLILELAGCDTTLREQIEQYVDGYRQIQAEGLEYVDGANGDDANPGTRDLPKKTIQNAIDLAAALMDEAEVRVAEGTYAVYETLVVREGISLYGGFRASDWTRDIDAYPTVIQGIAVETVIKPERGVTPATAIDGFSIKAAAGDTAHCIICDNCSPTIRYNFLDAGAGGVDTIGIRCRYSSPVINANSINAGSGSGAAWGIWNMNSNTRIWNNEIFGEGDHTKFKAIINSDNSQVSIQSNTIRVGTTAGGGDGIYSTDSIYLVENNIFFSTELPGLPTGCAIHDAADSPLLDALNNNDFYRCAACYSYGDPVTSLDFLEMIALLDGTIGSVSGNTDEDPQFERQSILPWNWHLVDTSPVKDAGLDLSDSFNHDRDGVPRSDPWSIGAYE